METVAHHLATTLKQLRHARSWSLSHAAAQTGVSKAMLGQIERGESSPTIATLWKIATGFNVAFSALITAAENSPPHFAQPGAAMSATTLFAWQAELGMEMLKVTLAARAHSVSTAHEKGVIEQIVVIAGELEVTLARTSQRLRAGDTFQFQADVAHAYTNVGEETVVFHNLIHYPRPIAQ